MNDEMHAFVEDVSRRAGALLLTYFRAAVLERADKGPWDVVTEADKAAEALIIGVIRERFPAHDVLAEESGRCGSSGRMLWLIDPLDGTLNFSRGLANWAVSVALAEDGEVYYGAVFDPIHDEFFYAERGAGATLNGVPLRTSGIADLDQVVISLSSAHGDMEEITRRNAERLWSRVMRLRMMGSLANALAAIAAGRLDAAIEVRGGPWDHAAGGLLVREAGGYTTAFDGQPLLAEATTVLAAATPALHRELFALLHT